MPDPADTFTNDTAARKLSRRAAAAEKRTARRLEFEARQEGERNRNRQMVGVKNETVDPTSITIPARLRSLNEEKVVEMMESMRKVGQINPILVYQYWTDEGADEGADSDLTLVAGRHRVEAAIRLGWTEINVRSFVCDRIEARKLEIAENLHRSELSALERAEHVAEWIRLAEVEADASQVETHHKAGQQPGGVNAAARELGVEKSEAHRSVKIADITVEAKAAAIIAGLADNKSALLEVAGCAAADQVEAVARIAAKKAAAKAKPKAAPTTPKPPPEPEPEAVEQKDDAPSLFDDDPAAAAHRRREVIDQIAGDAEAAAAEDAVEGEADARELFERIVPAFEAMTDAAVRVFSEMTEGYLIGRAQRADAEAETAVA